MSDVTILAANVDAVSAVLQRSRSISPKLGSRKQAARAWRGESFFIGSTPSWPLTRANLVTLDVFTVDGVYDFGS